MFLETLSSLEGNVLWASLAGFILMFGFFLFILVVGLYIYSSLALVAIAKKANHPSPNLAWIPFVGPAIVSSQIAGMPWWPILFVLGAVVPFIGFAFSLAFCVFSIIWMWKTFEKIGKPGWWAIMVLLPIVYFILLGVAAWSKK
jgi:hypothetical protein